MHIEVRVKNFTEALKLPCMLCIQVMEPHRPIGKIPRGDAFLVNLN